MGWFSFEDSLEDKYYKALTQTEWEWYKVDNNEYTRYTVFTPKDSTGPNKNITFKWYKHRECEEDAFWSNRFVSRSFVGKIEAFAHEWIIQNNIKKLGGYILDPDLQQAFTEAKVIMNAKWQIEYLTELIEKIRQKY